MKSSPTTPQKSLELTGLGLRGPHYQSVIEESPKLGFFEIITENYLETRGFHFWAAEKVRESYPLAMHGVSLNLGSADALDDRHLKLLKSLESTLQPFIVSDHLCWTGVNSQQWYDLFPLPMTEESADHVIQKISRAQDYLGRQIAVENISTYLHFKESTMGEAEFLSYIAERSDCLILLDINNIYVNQFNHGIDAEAYLKQIPAKRVAQYHLAGHATRGDFLFDTHDSEVAPDVWALFEKALQLIGPRPSMIERDTKIPPFEELFAESLELRKFLEAADEAAA